MNSFNAGRQRRLGAVCGLAVWVCLGWGQGTWAAQEPPAAGGTTHSVVLQYREQPGKPVANAWVHLAAQTAPFAKEPALGKGKVVRGFLKFGNSTDTFLPLVWDCTQRKLYLDLNRNRDLTDDGVLVSGDRNYGGSYYSQQFTNLHLAFKTPLGEHRALADLHLQSDNDELGAWLDLHSYWEGKISLGGKDWQIALVEGGGFAGKIGSSEGALVLLRPWQERQQAVNLEDDTLKGFRFCRNLFFCQQSYAVDCAYVQQAGAPGYRLDLKEQPATLGELQLSGQFIQRLLLTSGHPGEGATVVLDTPKPRERIPVGTYAMEVHLQQGQAEAHRIRSGPRNEEPVVVISATQPAVLVVGGPLTNTVLVSQQGRDLYLNYKLVGAGGQTYRLDGERKPPTFAVYQAGKQVGAGTFEFG